MAYNTKPVGVAYEDPYLNGATIVNSTITSPTVTGATVAASTVAVTGASTLAPPLTVVSTSAGTGSVDATGLSVTETISGVGGVGFAIKGAQSVNVAAGGYLSAVYGYLAFGASGKCSGLAAGVTGEIVLSAGTTPGTYAALDLEVGCPSGCTTGANTSFMYLTTYGTDASTFDASGLLFTLAGVTKGASNLLADTTTGPTIRPVQTLKVRTPDGIRYIPLYSTIAISA